jgi:hypothetical protein
LFSFARFDQDRERVIPLAIVFTVSSDVFDLRRVKTAPPAKGTDAGENSRLYLINPDFRAPKETRKGSARNEQTDKDEWHEENPEKDGHADGHVLAVHPGGRKPNGQRNAKVPQAGGSRKQKEDGQDSVPEESKEEESCGVGWIPIGCPDDCRITVYGKPRALWRVVKVKDHSGDLVTSQFRKTIREVAVAAVGHVVRDVYVVATNLLAAFGTRWDHHSLQERVLPRMSIGEKEMVCWKNYLI